MKQRKRFLVNRLSLRQLPAISHVDTSGADAVLPASSHAVAAPELSA